MTKIKPHWQILGALLLATGVALLFRAIDPDAEGGVIAGVVGVCQFLGKDVFMNLLKMIIVPLIVSSVVAGIASLHGMQGFVFKLLVHAMILQLHLHVENRIPAATFPFLTP